MKLEIKIAKKLTYSEKDLINKSRVREYGDGIIDFEEKAESIVFFVKDDDGIVAFGMLNKILITYLDKKYNILGIGQILAIKKGRGYGKFLMKAVKEYLVKKGETGVGFCGAKNMPFYEKCGFRTKVDLINRFRYKNPKTGIITADKDDAPGEGGGMYYNGIDNFMKNLLSTKSLAYSNIDFW